MKLPKDVESELKQFAKKSETDFDKISNEYEQEFNDNFDGGCCEPGFGVRRRL